MVVIDTKPARQRRLTREEVASDEIVASDYFGVSDERNRMPLGVWHFDEATATRIGIASPDYRSQTAPQANETVVDALRRVPAHQGRWITVQKMELPPGAYYPAIARPNDQHYTEAPAQSPYLWDREDQLIASLSQLRALVGQLDQIFQAVHPVVQNMACFGSSIRNLLILACTECEAQWRSVLKANAYPVRQGRNWSRQDYQKLARPMKLYEYGIALNHYPWLDEIRPFSGWEAVDGQFQLSWYDDYNAVKHDREESFPRATIAAAVSAVAACWAMIAAQYGQHGLREFDDIWRYFRLRASRRSGSPRATALPMPGMKHQKVPGTIHSDK